MSGTVTIPADVAKRCARQVRGLLAAKGDESLTRFQRDDLEAVADLLDPKPPTLRERIVDVLHHLNGTAREGWYEDADDILAVVAAAVADIRGPAGDIPRSADVIYRRDVLRLLDGAES